MDTVSNSPNEVRAFEPEPAGYIERFSDRIIRGWIADKANLDRPIALEVLVDGAFVAHCLADLQREDLAEAGLGNGSHGFAIELPRSLFDGQAHTVLLRDAETQWSLPELSGVVFDVELRSDFAGGAIGLRNRNLVGFAYRKRDHHAPLEVALRIGDEEIARTLAAQQPTSLGVEIQPSGPYAFSFDLDELDIPKLVSAKSRVVVLPEHVELDRQVDLATLFANLRTKVEGDTLLAAIDLAFVPRTVVPFVVYVENEIYATVNSWPLGDAKSISFRVPLRLLAKGEHGLSVRYGATNVDVGNSPQRLGHQIRRNLVKNSHLQKWAGREPEAWTVRTPDFVFCTRSYLPTPPEQIVSFGPNAISFACDRDRHSLTDISLEQMIAADGGRLDVLDVIVGGRADFRTDLVIAIAVNGASSRPVHIERKVVLWPNWGAHSARFELPQDQPVESVTITLSVVTSSAKLVQVAFVAAGPPGFEFEEGLRTTEESRSSNAVVNGDFQAWPPLLRQKVRQGRTKIADGWTLVCEHSSLGVEARLTELITRNAKTGGKGSLAYGIALHGQIEGRFLRLETDLDKLQIAAVNPSFLKFYARSASAPVSAAGLDRRADLAIAEIRVIDRRIVANATLNGDSDDRTLLTLHRNVKISSTGEELVLELPHGDAVLLREAANRYLYDPERILVLCFEFNGFVDCALTNVSFGVDPQFRRADQARAGYIAIEDVNITSQLSLLKGVDHWRESQQLYPPATLGEQRLRSAQPTAKWTWPEAAYRSVDIVVYVRDAIDEAIACLESIRRHTGIPHTVTIVDDASTGLTKERLRHHVYGCPWMRIVELENHVGYARAARVGIGNSTAEWIVLLSGDVVVTSGWLNGLFDVVDAKPDVAMVGPLSNAALWQSVPDLYDVNGAWKVNKVPDGAAIDEVAALVAALSTRKFPEVPLLNDACVLMRRSALQEFGELSDAGLSASQPGDDNQSGTTPTSGHTLAIADHVYVYRNRTDSPGSASGDERSKATSESTGIMRPGVDMREAQQAMAELTPLIELRKALREKLPRAGHATRRTGAGA